MDNGGILCKISDFSCDPVVKSCSDGKQEVTAADGKVGGITSMNSEISNVEGMGGREGAFTHDRRDYRNICHLCQSCHLSFRT